MGCLCLNGVKGVSHTVLYDTLDFGQSGCRPHGSAQLRKRSQGKGVSPFVFSLKAYDTVSCLLHRYCPFMPFVRGIDAPPPPRDTHTII